MSGSIRKILVVTPYFPPEGGGLENYAWQVAKRLKSDKCEVLVICLSKNKSTKEEIEGITVIRKKAHFVFSNTPIRLTFLFDVLKTLKSFKPDIIHTHTPVAFASDMTALASLFASKPLVTTYHTGSLIKGQLLVDLVARCYMLIEKFLLARSKKIIAVSNRIKDTHLRKYKQKTEVIWPGVDVNDMPKPVPYPDGEKNLLMISPLKKEYVWKGLPQMMDVMEQIIKEFPNAKLRVLGGGELKEDFALKIKNRNLQENIELLGQIPYQDIWKYYQQTNILLVPSTGNIEGTPSVIFEAMAQKRPVIASNISGIPDVVRDNVTGILIPEGNVDALTKTITDLFNDPNKASMLGIAGFDRVLKNYQWSKIVSDYQQIYDAILAEK